MRAMYKVVIFGNSAAGKSTLAKHLSEQYQLAHLDLDTLAWLPTEPPRRKPLSDSEQTIQAFINRHDNWVIEGCYADLLSTAMVVANNVIFLKVSIEQCVANAKARPWEPHKYASKAAQDKNLTMLIDWIGQYDDRKDTFSKIAHQAIFDDFAGYKQMVTDNHTEVEIVSCR